MGPSDGAGACALTPDVPTVALLHIGGGSTCGSAASQGRWGLCEETWRFLHPLRSAAALVEDAAISR